MTGRHDTGALGGNTPGRPAKTTAATALRAIKAAGKLHQALIDLGQLYGVGVDAVIGPDRIGLSIDCSTGLPLHREALAGDLAEITGADLQPHIDEDLWVHLTGRGHLGDTPVGIVLLVPPGTAEEAQA